MIEEKVVSLGKFGASLRGGPWLAPHFWFIKNTLLEHHVMTRKPTMIQKGIITFNLICFTEITYRTLEVPYSILKFLK